MATAVSSVSDPGDTVPSNDEAIDDLIARGYRPSPDEPFMGPGQLAYFRAKLVGHTDSPLRPTLALSSKVRKSHIRPAIDTTGRRRRRADHVGERGVR